MDRAELDRKYELFLLQRKRHEEFQMKSKLKEFFIKDILSFNRPTLNFSTGYFPGEVVEELLEVFNKTSLELTYKIHVQCCEESLNQLEEYVFSMRRTGTYDYNDRYQVMQSPGVKSVYKVALKVPNIKSVGIITGQIIVFSDFCKGKVIIPILGRVRSSLLSR